MRKVKRIVCHIKQELHDAEHYARDAMMERDDDHQLADLYIRLAEEEIKHAHLEHDQVVRMINERKQAGEKVHEAMMAVWDWEHEQMIQDEAEIRQMIGMYKA